MEETIIDRVATKRLRYFEHINRMNSKRYPTSFSTEMNMANAQGEDQLRDGQTASRWTATTDKLTPGLKPLGKHKTGSCGKPL